MIVKKTRQLFSAVKNSIKAFVQNPVNYVYIIIGSICLILILGYAGAKEIDEYIEENLTERINFSTDGCGNVYVRDGIIISFETVYYENNFIALQVKMNNTTLKETRVEASIDMLNENISFASDKDYTEYLIIGDAQYSNYDVNLKIIQGKRVLAEGVVHVVQSAENGTTFLEKTTVYYKPEMEIYYLGTHEGTMFMVFNNKTKMDLNTTFANEESEFSLTTPKETYQYIYISDMETVKMDVGVFEISIKEVTEEDIIIEKVDDTEQESGFQ